MQWALRSSAAAVALLLAAMPAHARTHRSRSWADSQFAAASHLQESLEARPAEQRARHDYQRVIDAYRRVYLGAPSCSKAEPSVVAAGQMLEEMGRRFRDPDVLRSAIQQYEFLRREYPGSKFRFDALYRIGEIYKDDLHDKAKADAAFEEFLRRYPHNQFAQAARSALEEPMQQQAAVRSKEITKASSRNAKTTASKSDKDSNDNSDADADVAQNRLAQTHLTKADAQEDSVDENSSNQPASGSETANGKLSRVLGIRHWSTPDYTRVAIDLDQGVKYQSQRIDNPDRVFFDLLNTRLDRKIAGKSFEVGDGLLKDVRVAQFKAGRSRIVLDLDSHSEFSASLLSNPPRLIIDIRNTDLPKSDVSNSDVRSGDDVHHLISKTPLVTEIAPGADSNAVSSSNSANDDSPTPARTGSEKPGRVSVVNSNGIKKTIVDTDDDAAAKAVVAKLDLPEIKPPSKVADTPEPSIHTKSGTGKNKRQAEQAAALAALADPGWQQGDPTA